MSSNFALAQKIPDLPRWVETRDFLLWGQPEIFGLQEAPDLALAIRDPESQSVFVVGTPTVSAVQVATHANTRGFVLAPEEQGDWLAGILPDWIRTRAILHTLADSSHLPVTSPEQVRFLDPSLLETLILPNDLRAELKSGAEESPIAATFVDGQPVAFCYAGSKTETLWDISIDTLAEHRRHGYAGLCVAYLIRHMQTLGKQPVWGALEENPASWRLAQKLGFVAMDALAIFEPPAEA
jgi:GNAT superfamily N-acetyltransferase